MAIGGKQHTNYIRHDLRGRIEAIPRNKQLGYYSDAYKLEFILPKFKMYKRILAEVLAADFCLDRGWTEENAIAWANKFSSRKRRTGFPYSVKAP